MKLTFGYIIRRIKESVLFNDMYRAYTEYKVARRYVGRKRNEIFNDIFAFKRWGEGESVSGPGSTLLQTEKIIPEISLLIQTLGLRHFLDIPCGDHHWMQKVDLTNVQYVGGDIVKSLIDRNNRLYGSHSKKFIVFDLTCDTFPKADLLMVRDCLVHLSFKDINAFLENLKRSEVKYLLTTTFPFTRRNYDITTGNWRPLNLLRPPFSFPQPKQLIVENCTESYGQYIDKSLGLWEVKNLPCSICV